jgi:transcriptional regulator with XRE-family HTH domain
MRKPRQKTLRDYCKKREITLEELAEITNVSVSQIYLIAKDPTYNVTIDTVRKIYLGTEKAFSVGLSVWDYIKLRK